MASTRDRQILNAIVNPLLPVGEAIFDDEEKLPSDLKDLVEDEQGDSPTLRDSRGLERQAIKEADDGNLAVALKLLAQALTLTPARPSIFNNRAQVHRLNSDVASAMADLDKALELSQGQGRSACQAFCQRGMIHRLEGRDDEAKVDFEKAAQLGSAFAKSALASMNPYAAMCNQMLKNVFNALENGVNEVEDPFKKPNTNCG